MRLIFALFLGLALTASCGVPKVEKPKSANSDSLSVEQITAVMTTDVELVEIVRKATNTNPRTYWIDAVVKVNFECSDEFDAVTHHTVKNEMNYTVNIAAMVRKNAAPGRQCDSKPFKLINVLLPSTDGTASWTDLSQFAVTVQPMQSQPIKLGNTLPGNYVGASRIKVKSVLKICPEETTCPFDGTIVNLQVENSCSESIGPVSHLYSQVNNELVLAVGSFFEASSTDARCSNEVKVEEFSLELKDFFVDSANSINLKVLGSK